MTSRCVVSIPLLVMLIGLISSSQVVYALSIGDLWKGVKNIVAGARDAFKAPQEELDRTLGELELEPALPGPTEPCTITCLYMVDGWKGGNFIFDLRNNAAVYVCYADGRVEDYPITGCDWEKGKCPRDEEIDSWTQEVARPTVVVSDDPNLLEKASARAFNALHYALPANVRNATQGFTVRSKKNQCTLRENGWGAADRIEEVLDYVPVPLPET